MYIYCTNVYLNCIQILGPFQRDAVIIFTQYCFTHVSHPTERLLFNFGAVCMSSQLRNDANCIHSCSRSQIVADTPHLVAWPAVSTAFWKLSSTSTLCWSDSGTVLTFQPEGSPSALSWLQNLSKKACSTIRNAWVYLTWPMSLYYIILSFVQIFNIYAYPTFIFRTFKSHSVYLWKAVM